jgi:methylenetetrahydrofolate dehydrogenase (NADP+)/methenyltetrahydrofolate cyclohydrolase
MSAKILDGKQCGKAIKQAVSIAVVERQENGLSKPGLAVILVGNDPASQSYVAHKQKACRAVGIYSELHQLPEDVSEEHLVRTITNLNTDEAIHGILLQLPLPAHLNADNLLEHIHPSKDVDGFHPYNLGRLVQRRPFIRPCTPLGVINLLKHYNIDLTSKDAVIIGASNIVGRPMALELLLEKCTVTVCHRFTDNLEKHVRGADILIAGIGKPGVIQAEWIKPGAIIVDIGFNRLDDGTIVGDIPFDAAKEKAAWITPVPGGVGQMTVATLLENTLALAQQHD